MKHSAVTSQDNSQKKLSSFTNPPSRKASGDKGENMTGYLGSDPVDAKFPTERGRNAKILRLHASPHQAVIYATGAGTGIVDLLWQVPGSSATILDAQIPYDPGATQDALGHTPKHYCSMEVAVEFASAAYARAQELASRRGEFHRPVIGLGMTAAVASETHRHRGDRVFVAVRTADEIAVAYVVFPHKLSRKEQGKICDLIGVNMIMWAYGDDKSQEALEFRQICMWRCRIESGHFKVMRWRPDRYTFHPSVLKVPVLNPDTLFEKPFITKDGACQHAEGLDPKTDVLFFMSANPLHFGHEMVAKQMTNVFGKRVIMAVTASHPDKGTVSNEELIQRTRQFWWKWPVLLSRDPGLFIDKARLYPRFDMMIGADAMMGILNPKYYGGYDELVNVLAEFRKLGTTFYVAGREVDGVWRHQANISIPEGYRDLFMPVQGRWDISSTQMRSPS